MTCVTVLLHQEVIATRFEHSPILSLGSSGF